ncbi:MAG: tetratricopeptide repeat protein [Deinococcales bacterium]
MTHSLLSISKILDHLLNLSSGNPMGVIGEGLEYLLPEMDLRSCYGEALSEAWQGLGQHQLDEKVFQGWLVGLDLREGLNPESQLVKALAEKLKEAGDLNPNLDEKALFRKARMLFEQKLSEKPSLLVPIYSRLRDDFEAFRQQHGEDLRQALGQLSQEQQEQIKAFQRQIEQLKTIPEELKSYLKSHIQEIKLSESIVEGNVSQFQQHIEGDNHAPIFNLVNGQVIYVDGKTSPLSELLERSFAKPLLKFNTQSFRSFELPSQLLRSDYEAVGFYGRDDLMAAWLGWAKQEGDFELKLVEGAGGMGKTRMAREFIKLLQAEGWQAGFLDAEALSRAYWPSFYEKPSLVVIDYVESKQELLKNFYQRWRESYPEGAAPLRLLLLCRESSWWEQIRAGLGLALFSEVEKLGALALSPQESYQQAARAYARQLKRAIPDNVPYVINENPIYQRVLFVHMLALLHVSQKDSQQPKPKALPSEESLLDGILALEQVYWSKRSIEGLASTTLETLIGQIMTVVSLGYQVEDSQDAREMAQQLPYLKGEKLAVIDGVMARCKELYRGQKLLIEPLGPDILAEHLLERTLLDKEALRVDAAVLLKLACVGDRADPDSTLQTLVRLMQRREAKGIQLIKEIFERFKEETQVNQAINFALPATPPVSLRDIAVQAGTLALEQGLEGNLSLIGNLSNHLSALGNAEEAAELQKQINNIFKALVEQDDAFLPDLARSLNNLGLRLRDLGKSEDALNLITEEQF